MVGFVYAAETPTPGRNLASGKEAESGVRTVRGQPYSGSVAVSIVHATWPSSLALLWHTRGSKTSFLFSCFLQFKVLHINVRVVALYNLTPRTCLVPWGTAGEHTEVSDVFEWLSRGRRCRIWSSLVYTIDRGQLSERSAPKTTPGFCTVGN